MTYPEALRYLEYFIDYEKIPSWAYKKSLRLNRFQAFLAALNNPQDNLRCIHVAGTKGKGSTCAFIAYILRAHGFKVGLYTSPHLIDFRERIRVLNGRAPGDFTGMVSRKELADITNKLKPAIEQFNRESPDGPLTFFEAYTALAFTYFKEKKVDFAVLETGLGGRLDATNTVRPLVCVITPISYEHTDKLGKTLTEIAREKAGIVKDLRNLSVIIAPQPAAALRVIRQRCNNKGVKLYEAGKHASYIHGDKDTFKVRGIFADYPDLKIKLLGEHQLINAIAAISAVEALRLHNIRVGIQAIRDGLYDTVWPGRCEIISKKPWVVLDGAQNAASSLALKKTIKDNFKYQKLILVLGISSDKDIKGICKELYGLADEVIFTKADTPRAINPGVLAKYFKGKNNYLTNNVHEARHLAKRIAGRQDLILACGSLFVVGEFRNDKS